MCFFHNKFLLSDLLDIDKRKFENLLKNLERFEKICKDLKRFEKIWIYL